MPLAIVLISLIVVGALLPDFAKKIDQQIQNFGNAFTKGPVSVVTNAWIEVAVIAAGLGFAIWIIEAKAAHHMGQEVNAPPVQSIGVASPPAFGSSGGYGFQGGGFSTSSNVSASAGHSGSTGHGAPGRKVRQTKTVTTKRSAFGG